MVEKALQLNREKAIFWTLSGALFISLCFYIFFVRMTIHNVVARENLENQAGQLTLVIGNKEFEYISKRNSVNMALARSMGFKEASVTAYLTAKSRDNFAYASR